MPKEQEMLRCVIMRGGTSKGIFLRENDLPKDSTLRDKVILAVFGSPDPRQVDGLGGADALTSKLAIIGPASRPDADVDYTFGQVSIESPVVDYSGNCGNISSAVGPYCIEEGIVRATEPVTVVRIHNTNTKKIIEAEVPIREGRPVIAGDCEIDGVPGKGARIMLNFLDIGGAVTGKLLPTGKVRETLRLEDGSSFTVSIVDAANPFVFLPAQELGLTGAESATELSSKKDVLDTLEKVRSVVAEMISLVKDRREATAKSPAVPKVAIVGAPREYTDSSGRTFGKDDVDLCARMMSLQKPHKAYAVTGAICAAAAAKVEGSVVNEVASDTAKTTPVVRVGHPAGRLLLEVESEIRGGEVILKRAALARTARRIMEGYVFVPLSKVVV